MNIRPPRESIISGGWFARKKFWDGKEGQERLDSNCGSITGTMQAVSLSAAPCFFPLTDPAFLSIKNFHSQSSYQCHRGLDSFPSSSGAEIFNHNSSNFLLRRTNGRYLCGSGRSGGSAVGYQGTRQLDYPSKSFWVYIGWTGSHKCAIQKVIDIKGVQESFVTYFFTFLDLGLSTLFAWEYHLLEYKLEEFDVGYNVCNAY